MYQRYINSGATPVSAANDGIVAIPIHSTWGPLGVVKAFTAFPQVAEVFGQGAYSANHTVKAVEELFKGGATKVYAYRLGTGGTAASKTLTDGPTITAKYPGAVTMAVSVAAKIGDSTKKVLTVYFGNEAVESFEFAANGTTEGANLIAATAGSAYIVVTQTTEVGTVPVTAAAAGALSGGVNPTVTNANYSTAFAAFERYYYNVITLDVDDDANVTLSLLLQAYLDEAYLRGKLGIAIVGEKTTVAFATRLTHARAFNDEKVVYLGGGWMSGTESKDGVLAICYTAGVIASTLSNRGVTHTVVTGATDLCESLTYSQYEDAINAGVLMVSLAPDGVIWYDSGINTLTVPAENQDAGWKKIRRVKVRFELFDRLDRALSVKIGRVSANNDGIADIVQTGQRVVDAMATEGKILPGGTFTEDPENPYTSDSAWFIVQVDDLDSLEKIYLQYRFRYNQGV